MIRTSIATVCLSGELERKLDAIAAAGFDAIELFEADLIASPLRPAELRALTDERGLAIELFQPFRDFEGVDAAGLERNLDRARRKFELMAELGAPTMLVCSSVDPEASGDPALAAEQLALLADEAAERGLRIAYEALAWGHHVSDYRDAWRIVEMAGHAALGTCLDSFHILSRGSDLGPIADIPGERIFYLQLADAPVIGMEPLSWSRHHRCFPGQGGFELADFMRRVLATGFDGSWSLEVFNDHFRQADPHRIARDAHRSLLALAEQVDAVELPPTPRAERFAFAELAVGPGSGPETGAVLESMGFEHRGPHRTKPVSSWGQGAARVLLNHGVGAESEPILSAVGVETADAASAAERAERLGAGLEPRLRGPGEADLATVTAPDGTSILFCPPGSEPGGEAWLGDFVDLGETTGDGAGVTGIDHIVLSQPFDYFDEALLFHRTLLGLEPGGSSDLAAPSGLLSSRSLESPGGGLRLAITVPRLAGEGDARLGELQHVAFASDDLLGSAERMRERGAPLLEIPDNYYDDLASRTQLDDERIERLRSLGVLYDADAGGEFLQLFTRMVGERLFFEVVERIGPYRGFGAANSPVRLAAQLRHLDASHPAPHGEERR